MDFLYWFAEYLERLIESIWYAMKKAACWALLIVTLPVWLLPFVYWFFFVREKED